MFFLQSNAKLWFLHFLITRCIAFVALSNSSLMLRFNELLLQTVTPRYFKKVENVLIKNLHKENSCFVYLYRILPTVSFFLLLTLKRHFCLAISKTKHMVKVSNLLNFLTIRCYHLHTIKQKDLNKDKNFTYNVLREALQISDFVCI